MPIVDLQRRLREVGRIRIGQQVMAKNGKRRPAKLDRFRFTSRDQHVIDVVARAHGGDVKPWDAGDGVPQHEVITTATSLNVIIPPSDMGFSQWYEMWSGGGCQRRCDGVHDLLRDVPCDCNPELRDCKITTRVSVILPELPGLGVWRLESHGYYAGVELSGAVEVCRMASERGQMLPARLRLEERTVKRLDPDGKPITLRFVVPVLDVDVALTALGLGGGPGAIAAQGDDTITPGGWSPVGELPEAPLLSVESQLAEVQREPTTKPRRNAAEPIKPTGLAPRPAAGRLGCALCGESLEGSPVAKIEGEYVHTACRAAALADEDDEGAASASQGSEDEGEGDGTAIGTRSAGDPGSLPLGGAKPSAVMRTAMMAGFGEVLPINSALPLHQRTEISHDMRVAFCAQLGYVVASSNELDTAAVARVLAAIDDVKAGRLIFDGETLITVERDEWPPTVDVETGEIL